MERREENQLADRQVSRRKMLKTVGAGSAVALSFATLFGEDVVNAQTTGDDPQTILNLAATAEALAITAFHSIITQSTFFGGLRPVFQNYLRSALTQEQDHFDFLVASGARPLANRFFFPNGILQNLGLYVFVTDVLEGVFIGAYLASIRRFAELNRPDLSWTAASVMGIEAEHKALNRAMGIEEVGGGGTTAGAGGSGSGSGSAATGNLNSPTREPFEPATVFQVSQVTPTLGPVLTGGVAPATAGRLIAGVNFGVGPVVQPTAQQARQVGNLLTPVPPPLRAFTASGKRIS